MSRSFFTLSCLLLALLSGCSKSHSSQPDIMGQWRLMTSVGTGIVSTGIQDYSHEMRLLQLLPDSSYKKTGQGPLTESGSYSISIRYVSTRNIPGSDTIISFKPSAGTGYGALVNLHGRELYLRLAGAVENYVKQ